MKPSESFEEWFDKQPPMSDEEKQEMIMLWFCAIIRPIETSQLLALRTHLVRTVQVSPEDEIGLELIDGELALRELGQR